MPHAARCDMRDSRPALSSLAKRFRQAPRPESLAIHGRLQWQDFASMAMQRCLAAEARFAQLEEMSPTAADTLKQRAVLLESLKLLGRVLQRCEAGSYGTRPDEVGRQELTLVRAAVKLRRAELLSPYAYDSAVEPTHGMLSWFDTILDQASEQKLRPASSAWINTARSVTQSLREAEQSVPGPSPQQEVAKAEQVLHCWQQLGDALDTRPESLHNASFRASNDYLRGLVQMRKMELQEMIARESVTSS